MLLAGALALAGCATIAEGRVKNALTNAGLSEPIATCMADRMTERLTIPSCGGWRNCAVPSRSARESSLQDYLHRVRRVGDSRSDRGHHQLGCAVCKRAGALDPLAAIP